MGKSLALLSVFVFAFVAAPAYSDDPVFPTPPQVPDTSVSALNTPSIEDVATHVEQTLHPESAYPARIVIPSIRVDSAIEHVGINEKGEMAVPDGRTNNVGWYRFGTVPGDVGSAVMDAHVYAAFKKLKNLKVGSHIYVVNEKGEARDFIVKEAKTYALNDVPLETLFNRADTKRLNLITCAGRFLPALDTYDHRRIVYAELVE